MRLASLLFATAAALTAVPAFAAPSSATFGYSGGPSGSAVLTVDGQDFTATSRGWVREDGIDNDGGADGNYIAGRCGSSDICAGDDRLYRNFFSFDLADLAGATSAMLNLAQPLNAYGFTGLNGYISDTASLTYTLYDYLGFTAPEAGGLAAYADLGAGLSFGSVVVDAATNGTTVSIAFNAAGLGALNAAIAGGGGFTFGGTTNAQAVLPGVPEPATWALLIGGFGLTGGALRARGRKVAFA